MGVVPSLPSPSTVAASLRRQSPVASRQSPVASRQRQPPPPSSSTAVSAFAGHDSFQLYPHRRLMEQFLATSGLRVFFALLLFKLACAPKSTEKIFLASHGRSHRLAGAANLAWLVLGATPRLVDPPSPSNDDRSWAIVCLAYDVVLGALGIAATLTAARAFPHKRVANRPGESGTLSRSAIVTQSEMVEHAFYQGVNVWQALYLHVVTGGGRGPFASTFVGRMILLWFVTFPWAWRRAFPVNSFSSNWTNENLEAPDERIQKGTMMSDTGMPIINRMYRVKKLQYIFYKHFVLHGLNISVAFPKIHPSTNVATLPLPQTHEWRVFWIALNTSYVMEFFMQSMVKRGLFSQRFAMFMNGLLMASSTLAALGAVFGKVRTEAAIISLLLNFINRRREILNTMVTGFIFACV